MTNILELVAPYRKAVVPFVLIVIAIVADLLGADVGLDVPHYVALLLGNGAVFAVPNETTSPTLD